MSSESDSDMEHTELPEEEEEEGSNDESGVEEAEETNEANGIPSEKDVTWEELVRHSLERIPSLFTNCKALMNIFMNI